MNNIFFIIGPESSGTRLITEIFINAGCFGSSNNSQIIDEYLNGTKYWDEIIPNNTINIVIRRSIPYGTEWPNLAKLHHKLSGNGCNVMWIILIRDGYSLIQSKLRQGHKMDQEEAQRSLLDEYLHIFEHLSDIRPKFEILDTSLLYERKEKALKRLSRITGLKFNCSSIINEDNKYYDNHMK